MTWRITDRATFEALKRSGKRARCGPLSIVFLADGGEKARVAYAIGRHAGGAVERNRMRRRLRAAMSSIEGKQGLRPGVYLVLPGRETAMLGYDELVSTLHRAVRKVQREDGANFGAKSDRSATQRT